MYGLCGFASNIKSVFKLSAPFAGQTQIKTVPDLKPFFVQFLNRHQPDYPVESQPELIVMDPVQALRLMGSFSGSRINDLLQEKMVGEFYQGETQWSANARVSEALAALKKLNPEASELLNLVIHSILLCGSNLNSSGLKAHGGTSSKCVGLMWLSMRGDLSLQDVIELLIHEMTHTLVFIDEFNHGHFDYDELTKVENWARSSILNRQRPMDKVVHSIVVAHEILYARSYYLANQEKLSVHPDSQKLMANALAAIRSVKQHPHRDRVCRPRALALIDLVEESLSEISSRKVEHVHAL